MNEKYGKTLTILLIVAIVAVMAILGYVGVKYYKNYLTNNEARKYVDKYEEEAKSKEKGKSGEYDIMDVGDGGKINTGPAKSELPKYKGFDVIGTIEIPKTDAKYPILLKVTVQSLNASVAKLSGGNLNEPGNVTIGGHNYRNGTFFSNNYKLEEGDTIYITDNSGKKVTYTIYKKYNTDPEDISYQSRDTQGKREISLTTCNDDSSQRIIILAKEK